MVGTFFIVAFTILSTSLLTSAFMVAGIQIILEKKEEKKNGKKDSNTNNSNNTNK